MLEVTPLATKKLAEYLQQNKLTSSIRVVQTNGGCSGPVLSLALDEENPQDKLFKQDELTFLVETPLLEQCGSIIIDYVDAGQQSGFSLQSANPLPGAGGCSSGSCGSGGCGV